VPRAIWSGSISFGLVNVPVKVYPAVSRKTVRFHQLHDADGVPIRQKRVCPSDGKEVPYEHVVKGYEIAKDQYVVIEPEELEALDPKKTRTIDIQDFVELDQIDPVLYDNSYYLAPDKGAAKAYKLLLSAMEDAGKVAIARVVIRTKEYLAAIRPAGKSLMMSTMIFGDEVVDAGKIDELPASGGKASAKEVQMARRLIDSLSVDFDPGRYRDEYRERVLDLIERKAAGEEISVQAPEEEAGASPDLMAALEASLAESRGEAKRNGAGTRRKATSKRKAAPTRKAAPRRKATKKPAGTAGRAKRK
jgi:DNA end-binding protein Ku